MNEHTHELKLESIEHVIDDVLEIWSTGCPE